MCPSPPLDASVPTARAKRYDLVAGLIPQTLHIYKACDTATGLEIEEGFLANFGRKERDVGFDSG